MRNFKKFKHLLIAASSVLVVTTVCVLVIQKLGGPPAEEQFVLFRNLQPGEQPLAVAQQYLGDGAYEHRGFFGVDYRSLDNPDLVGMVL